MQLLKCIKRDALLLTVQVATQKPDSLVMFMLMINAYNTLLEKDKDAAVHTLIDSVKRQYGGCGSDELFTRNNSRSVDVSNNWCRL